MNQERVKVFLFLLSIYVSEAKIVTICENESAKSATCNSGKLAINGANFGRKNSDVCSGNKQTWFTTCKNDIKGVVQAKCQGKNTCELRYTDLLKSFKDECPFVTNKYFEIDYSCNAAIPITTNDSPKPIYSKEKKIEICDFDLKKMTCGDRQKISVKSAFWGSDAENPCRSYWNKNLPNNRVCSKEKIFEDLQSFCNGKQSCAIFAHSWWIGEPCKDISKYFKATYDCTGLPPLFKKTLKEPLTTLLMCTGGTFPHIVNATYGSEDSKCTTDAAPVVRYKCRNTPVCPVFADAGYYGDPCPRGTIKYLSIFYYCGEKEEVKPTVFIPPVPTAAPVTPKQATCGKSTAMQSRVLGGTDAKRGAWPWQVAVYTSSNTFVCGGSVINPLWLVTAAHCFEDDKQYYFVIGDTDRSKIEGSEFKFTPARIIKHPQYGSSNTRKNDNDIALVKLTKPILFGTYIAPVCLPKQDVEVNAGTKCFVTGWGQTSFVKPAAIKLQQVQMTTVTADSCKQKLATAPGTRSNEITPEMLCADGNYNETACHGDSGGPFVCETGGSWVLQGIVSFGSTRCAVQDMYLVLTKVSKFISWINSAIKTY